MAGKRFSHRHTIRFGEIDYAGIVYYPNFFDFYQQVEEEFMAALGYPYPHLLRDLKLGFPIVHVEADFKHPFRYGDTLEIELCVSHLGSASVSFHFDVFDHTLRRLRATANIDHVLINTELFKSQPIPDALRVEFSKYLCAHAP